MIWFFFSFFFLVPELYKSIPSCSGHLWSFMGMPNCCNTRFLVRLPFGHHSCGLPVPNAAFPITITAHDVAEKRGKRYKGCPHNLIKNGLVIQKMTKNHRKKDTNCRKWQMQHFPSPITIEGPVHKNNFWVYLEDIDHFWRYMVILTVFCRFGYFLAVLGHFLANDGEGKCCILLVFQSQIQHFPSPSPLTM